MAYFKLKDLEGTTYFVDAANYGAAIALSDGLVSGENKMKDITTAIKHDFSLLDTSIDTQWKILTIDGYSYYGTAISKKAMIDKFVAAFPGKVFYSCKPVSKKNYQLLTQNEPVYRAINTHFGQTSNGQDYPESRIAEAITKAQLGKYNCFRDSYGSIDDSMAPSVGNRFPQLYAAASAANIEICMTHSLTMAGSKEPLVKNAMWTAAVPDSSSWSKAEISAMYTKAYNRGANFATRYPLVKIYCIGSEIDNLDDSIKLRRNTSTGAKAPAEPKFNSTIDQWVWTSKTAGSVVDWDMRYYPMYLAAIAGYINGTLSVTPNAKFSMNCSSYHYGLFIRFYTDLPRFYNGTRLNWFCADWYNTEEYGTDTSRVFSPSDRSNKGQAIENIHKLFVKTGLCDGAGIMEIGFNTNRSNPEGLTQAGWFELARKRYHNDPRTKFIADYELYNEPNFRKTSEDPAERTYGLTDTTLTSMSQAQYFPKGLLENEFISTQ